MQIKAVIFDMDGVLIDAKDWHYEALNRALAIFGYDIDRHSHETRFDGLPTKTKLEILSSERQLPRGLHAFINSLKQRYTAKMVEERLVPNKEHVEAMVNLRRSGVKLGLASNSIRATIQQMMRLAKLDCFLDFYLSNEDVKNPKPAPQIYLKAMHLANVSPQECLIVEDSPFGLQAAYASGAHVMQVHSVHDVNYQNIMTRICEVETISQSAEFRKVA